MALSTVRKSRVDAGIEPFVSLERNKTQTLEPVSSTSRRGARAAYHDEYPRDFGPGIAYTVS